MRLPKPRYRDRIQKQMQTQFGGICHRSSAMNGEIYDAVNLSSDEYPLLAPRRNGYGTRGDASLIESGEHLSSLFACDGTGLYATASNGENERVIYFPYNGGAEVILDGLPAQSDHIWCRFGDRVLLFPHELVITRTDGGAFEARKLENASEGAVIAVHWTPGENNALTEIMSEDGTFKAFGNVRVGDTVTLKIYADASKTALLCEKTATVRSSNATTPGTGASLCTLIFDDNAFSALTNGETYYAELTRSIPDLTVAFVHDNRVWGAKGNTIYVSKLGDPFNWNTFDGLDSDSFAVDVMASGEITGGCLYRGYPTFFTEREIFKVYGDVPSNYQVVSSVQYGVKKGFGGSLCAAGNYLFYVSDIGLMRYDGSVPVSINRDIEDYRITEGNGCGKAFSTEQKYFLPCALKGHGEAPMLVYDVPKGLFHIEKALEPEKGQTAVRLLSTAYGETVYLLQTARNADGTESSRLLYRSAEKAEQTEGPLSEVTFAPFFEDTPDRKGLSKLQLRFFAKGTFDLSLLYDSTEEEEIYTYDAAKDGPMDLDGVILPIIPKRADHVQIRIRAKGYFRIYALTRCFYVGSPNK